MGVIAIIACMSSDDKDHYGQTHSCQQMTECFVVESGRRRNVAL